MTPDIINYNYHYNHFAIAIAWNIQNKNRNNNNNNNSNGNHDVTTDNNIFTTPMEKKPNFQIIKNSKGSLYQALIHGQTIDLKNQFGLMETM